MGRLTGAVVAALAIVACRERAEAVQGEAQLRDLVRSMMPSVATAAQLKFKREPLVLRRTRRQVRDYVVHKFDQDLPPSELAGLEAALHRFGLIPDTMRLRPTMIDLLTEQVAGYYDPDSNALYIPDDIEPGQLRVVVSHELGHALQDQYVSLDSIITQHGHNDRRSAAQAVLEGQATVVQLSVLMPEQQPYTYPVGWFWQQRAVMSRLQTTQMERFARAPLWLREGLIFPYLGGADFVVWFRKNRPNRSVLASMPTSTEQILHPDRFAGGDEPTQLAFGPAPDSLRFEDGLGEFETRLLLQQHLGDEAQAVTAATGWDGDRYQVLGAGGEALVWYSVWDDAAAADRFAATLERAWRKRADGPTARRSEIKRLAIDGRPGVRLVDAPTHWTGWRALPRVRVLQ